MLSLSFSHPFSLSLFLTLILPTYSLMNRGQKTFETYKLITVIAAGVGGLAIIGVIIVSIVKWQNKKRRLVRDIEALNRTNRMTDLKTKVVGIGKSDPTKKDKKKKGDDKKGKVFTSTAPFYHFVVFFFFFFFFFFWGGGGFGHGVQLKDTFKYIIISF